MARPDFFFRKDTHGPGYVIYDGDFQVGWEPTREGAMQKVDYLEREHGHEALGRKADEFWRSVGIDTTKPQKPRSQAQLRRDEARRKKVEEDALKKYARDYVAKHRTIDGLPPHIAKYAPRWAIEKFDREERKAARPQHIGDVEEMRRQSVRDSQKRRAKK